MLDEDLRPPFLETLLLTYARWFPIRQGKLRITNWLWRFSAGGGGVQRLAKLNRGGFMIRCDLEEMLQRQFYFFGTYLIEDELLDCWSGVAREAEVVFDVGANAGIYSLSALAAQPAATVHAFEPTPEIAASLRETAQLNRLSGLQVHEFAIANETGHLVLHRFRGDSGDNGGMNYVTHDDGGSGLERVACVRLDAFCREKQIDYVDLMKLDIQGYEAAGLAGAGTLIGEGRVGTLFMELNWAEDPSMPCPATDSIRLLKDSGYLFSPPVEELRFQEAGEWIRDFSDIVARHPSAEWRARR